MNLLILILIGLIVGALLFYAARLIMDALKVPPPLYSIILALLIIILALWIAQAAGLL
jgi:hypothetical protein